MTELRTDIEPPPPPPPPHAAPSDQERPKPYIPGKLGGALLAALVVLLAVNGGWSMVVFVLALVVVITLHELGHFLTAKWSGMKVTQFFLGFGPTIWSTQRGETEYGIKVVPAGAFVRIIGMNNLEQVEVGDEPRSYRQAPFHKRLIVVSAGSAMHFAIALVCIWSLLVFAGGPRGRLPIGDIKPIGWSIEEVLPGTAAADAGIGKGDRITGVDGQAVGSTEELSAILRSSAGKAVTLTVDRAGQTLTLPATVGERDGRGFLGISMKQEYPPNEKVSPLVAIPRSFEDFGLTAVESVKGIGRVFSPSGLSSLVSDVTSSNEQGPAVSAPGSSGSGSSAGAPSNDDAQRPRSLIGIAQIGAQVTGSAGWVGLFSLMVLLNVFIGLLNLIPLLPFDGGHVAVAIYEKLRSMLQGGRRYQADYAKLLPLTYAVVAVLGFVFVSTVYLDIVRGSGLD